MLNSVILRAWVLVRPKSNSQPPAWQPDAQPTEPPVRGKVDNAIHRINHYPLDIAIGFANTYPADSDLSGG